MACMKKHAAPIIAAILLLLPVLYVGSYLALVTPCRTFVHGKWTVTFNYRIFSWRLPVLYYPLEQIDRKVRPEAWGISN
jgi:hypothetical protein